MLRKSMLLLTLLLSLSACARLSAEPLVDVAVIDRDSGLALPQYRHRTGQWIAGSPGHRYSVRLTNTTGQRVLVVLSIDGINAVTGQTAHPGQGGYVLAPWESTEIHGWRKSLQDVAQFVFTDTGDSYAARTGRPDNVGVIGVAVFREEARRYSPYPYGYSTPHDRARTMDESARPAASADKAMAEQEMGTGHGQHEWSPVGTTEFRRASRQPQQISQLRYDNAHRLLALGIIPRPRHPRFHATPPQAFPQGFVADPPGY